MTTPRISRWSAEFEDPNLERQFRLWSWKDTVRRVQFGLILAALAFMVFLYPDYLAWGLGPEFNTLAILRGALVGVFIVFLILTTQTSTIGLLDYTALVAAISSMLVTLLLVLLNHTHSHSSMNAVIVVLGVYLFLFNNRILRIAAIAIGGSLIYTVTYIITQTHDLNEILGHGMAFFVVNLLCFYIVNHLNRLQRSEYIRIKEYQHLEQALRKLATTDPLTGIANRRSFLEQAPIEVARSRRYDRALSILMLDVDHFKKINDQYGHAVGDEVLRRLVKVCSSELRENDMIGRLGGEEFAILLPETSLEMARTVAERLRGLVESTTFEDTDLTFTVSIGLAQVRPSNENAEETIRRADEGLYEAKRKGRNRVEVSRQ